MSSVEPLGDVYQCRVMPVPGGVHADKLNDCVPQLEVAPLTIGAAGIVFTVMVITLEVTADGLAQTLLPLRLTVHLILSP